MRLVDNVDKNAHGVNGGIANNPSKNSDSHPDYIEPYRKLLELGPTHFKIIICLLNIWYESNPKRKWTDVAADLILGHKSVASSKVREAISHRSRNKQHFNKLVTDLAKSNLLVSKQLRKLRAEKPDGKVGYLDKMYRMWPTDLGIAFFEWIKHVPLL